MLLGVAVGSAGVGVVLRERPLRRRMPAAVDAGFVAVVADGEAA